MKLIELFGFSRVAAILLTLGPAAVATAQPTCPGDCNGNRAVAVNELITGVNIVLGRAQLSACPSFDTNENGTVTVNELIAAVGASLDGCGGGATFADVQAIFDESCAVPVCHSGAFPAGDMNLEADESFDEIVGVEPDNAAAADMGLLRVDPSNPNNSFLLLKVAGPLSDPSLGTQMPQFQPPLSEDEVGTIREWIEAGANP